MTVPPVGHDDAARASASSANAPDIVAHLASGTRLGPYEIEAFIAAGGMGEVYRGKDTRLGRTVAIKVLPAHAAADSDRRRRFEQEARAVSSLNHPHICVVHDIGCERPVTGPPSAAPSSGEPVHFLVMEYLDGQTLAHRLSRGAVPIAQVLDYGAQIADALHAAHRAGITHRDLKPGNVMLTRDGAKLLDFGLARLTQPPDVAVTTTAQTQPGMIFGTLPYMAPEQLEGRPIDARTDLFALGAVLYEMVTGRRAFEGTNAMSVISAVLEHEPPPVSTVQPLASPALARLIATCLAKDPDRRWDSAHDVAEQLRGLVEMDRAARGAVAPTPRWSVARRWLPVAGAIVALLGALALWQFGVRGPAPIETAPRQVTTSATWDADPAVSPDGTQVAYSSGESGNADIWVVDVREGTPLRLTYDPAWDASPAWFPDSTQIAFVSDRSGSRSIWKVGRLGGTATLLVPDAEDPAISPDGQQIAFVRAERAYRRLVLAPLADVAKARTLTTDADGLWDHRDPAWSPDGRTICYSAQRDLWCIQADGGRARRLTTDGELDSEPAWSSDGRSVVFSSLRNGTQALWRVSAEGGRPVRLTAGNGPESRPSVSRDGKRVVYTTFLDNLDLVLRDLVSGREKRYGGVRSDIEPALSPDERTLYFVSDRRGKYDLWSQPLSGIESAGPPSRLTDYPGSVSMPSCSPDGQWVAFGHTERNQREILVIPASGGPGIRVTDASSFVGEPAWSPDGGSIAFLSDQSGTIRLWIVRVMNGRPIGRAKPLGGGTHVQELPAWSPDGTRIAYVSDGDVWVVNVSGASTATRVTSGAGAGAVRWLPGSNRLLVNGSWGGASYAVRAVLLAGGAATPIAEVEVRSRGDAAFDISRDGRILALPLEERRGNVWALEATSRMY